MDKNEKISKVLSYVLPIVLSFIPLVVFLILAFNSGVTLVNTGTSNPFFLFTYITQYGFGFAMLALVTPISVLLIELADFIPVKRVVLVILSIVILIASGLVVSQGLSMLLNDPEDTFIFDFFQAMCTFGVTFFAPIYVFFRLIFKGKWLNFLSPIIVFGGCLGIGVLFAFLGQKFSPFFAFILPTLLLIPVFLIAAGIYRLILKSAKAEGIFEILSIVLNFALAAVPLILTLTILIPQYQSGAASVFPLTFVFASAICIVTVITCFLGNLHLITIFAGLVLSIIIWVQYTFLGYNTQYNLLAMGASYACSFAPMAYYIFFRIFKVSKFSFLSSLLGFGVAFGIGMLVGWLGSNNMGTSIAALLIAAVTTLVSIFLYGSMSGDIKNWNWGESKDTKDLKDPDDWANYIKDEIHPFIGFTSLKCDAFAIDKRIVVDFWITSNEDDISTKYKNIEYVENHASDKLKKIAKKCPFKVELSNIYGGKDEDNY